MHSVLGRVAALSAGVLMLYGVGASAEEISIDYPICGSLTPDQVIEVAASLKQIGVIGPEDTLRCQRQPASVAVETNQNIIKRGMCTLQETFCNNRRSAKEADCDKRSDRQERQSCNAGVSGDFARFDPACRNEGPCKR